jgi:hypothetical protein
MERNSSKRACHGIVHSDMLNANLYVNQKSPHQEPAVIWAGNGVVAAQPAQCSDWAKWFREIEFP